MYLGLPAVVVWRADHFLDPAIYLEAWIFLLDGAPLSPHTRR